MVSGKRLFHHAMVTVELLKLFLGSSARMEMTDCGCHYPHSDFLMLAMVHAHGKQNWPIAPTNLESPKLYKDMRESIISQH